MTDTLTITGENIAILGHGKRRRLPYRRPSVTESIVFGRADGSMAQYDATIGFDELARPKEIFLSGAKEGSDMAAVLSDCAVALSVALQHGVAAEALALSIARSNDGSGAAASVIGSALDVLVRYERGEE